MRKGAEPTGSETPPSKPGQPHRRQRRVPRFARFLVQLLVGSPSAEFIVGDLDEAFLQETGDGRGGARLRYWRLALASIGSRWSGRRRDSAAGGGAPPRQRSRGLVNDVRFAARLLRRSPAFTAVAVLTLALGIGANTAVFSVVNGVLLRPLPYDDPGELVNVWQVYYEWQDSEVEVLRNFADSFPASWPVFLAWRERAHVFDGVAAYAGLNAVAEGPDTAEWVPAVASSGDLFDLLGVEPLIGRDFSPEEDAGAEHVVVIGYSFWMDRFGGDPAVLGRQLRLTGVPFTIIGVMPAGFYFPGREQQMWVPLSEGQRAPVWTRQSLAAIARLRPGISLRQAQREMDAITLQILEDNPESPKVGIRLVGRVDQVAGDTSKTLFLLMAAVGLVLLVTAANLAGLLLQRATGRRQEIAVRRALGAGNLRLSAQLMVESFLLALGGGALGLAATASGMGWLKTLLPASIPRSEDITVDWRVLAFTAAVSVAIAALSGLASVAHAARRDLASFLRTRSTGGGGGRRVRSLLVVGEVMVAVVLLVGASLLVTSYFKLMAVDRGFDESNVLTFNVSAPLADWDDPQLLRDFYRRALEEIERIPGVRSVATVSRLPFGGGQSSSSFTLAGGSGGETEGWSLDETVGPAYFETLGIRLLGGRLFDATDGADGERVAIINRRLADYYWPGGDPIGKTLRDDDVVYTIIGVVADSKHAALGEEVERMRYYIDAQRDPQTRTSVAVRTEVPPSEVVADMRAAVRAAARGATISEVASLESLVARTTAWPRFRSLMLASLATIAVMLAVLGVYAVVALSVAARRREIGVRMTLGARSGDIRRQVLAAGARLIVPGVVLGVAAAVAAVRLLQSYVFEVPTTDPLTFAGVALAVAAVAGAATWIPARRATRIEPLVVLRGE